MKKFYETPAVECRMVGLASVIAASKNEGDFDPNAQMSDRVKARPTTYGAPAQFDF